MKVQVYKNLNRGDWSIRVKGKVIDHRREVTLANVSFHVGESSRQRVIRNRCREVHAWCVGELVETAPNGEGRSITYNPYRSGAFTYRDTNEEIRKADYVVFTALDGAIAY